MEVLNLRAIAAIHECMLLSLDVILMIEVLYETLLGGLVAGSSTYLLDMKALDRVRIPFQN